MSEFDFIDKKRNSIPKDTKIFIKKSFDIIERLHELMKEQGITQKELSERMGKKESEVSKWINGVQNFTIKTLSKLEAALGEEVIHVPCYRNSIKILQTQEWRQKWNSYLSTKAEFTSVCKIIPSDFTEEIEHMHLGIEEADVCKFGNIKIKVVEQKIDPQKEIRERKSLAWTMINNIPIDVEVSKRDKVQQEINIGI